MLDPAQALLRLDALDLEVGVALLLASSSKGPPDPHDALPLAAHREDRVDGGEDAQARLAEVVLQAVEDEGHVRGVGLHHRGLAGQHRVRRPWPPTPRARDSAPSRGSRAAPCRAGWRAGSRGPRSGSAPERRAARASGGEAQGQAVGHLLEHHRGQGEHAGRGPPERAFARSTSSASARGERPVGRVGGDHAFSGWRRRARPRGNRANAPEPLFPLESPTCTRAAESTVRFEVRYPTSRPHEVELKVTVAVLGRDPSCDLVINDERCSRRHAVHRGRPPPASRSATPAAPTASS